MKTKTFRFEYQEYNRGYIEVEASSKDEALELAQCGDGTIHINKCDWAIGENMLMAKELSRYERDKGIHRV